MGILSGKKALVVGVATNRSIAFGIAQAMQKQGAEIALTYQQRLQSRVEKCAKNLNSNIVIPCDVSDDKQIDTAFDILSKHWDNFDILVHSVAFAPKESLEGSYLDATTRENFLLAHDISSFSLTALSQKSKPMLNKKGAILTVSYLGALRAMPNYNVMGVAKASLEASVRYLAASFGELDIRVNAISSGAIKTLAASGIKNFNKLYDYAKSSSILKRNVTIEEVGNTAAFMCSDLSSAITGETIYVDGGYNIYDGGVIV